MRHSVFKKNPRSAWFSEIICQEKEVRIFKKSLLTHDEPCHSWQKLKYWPKNNEMLAKEQTGETKHSFFFKNAAVRV